MRATTTPALSARSLSAGLAVAALTRSLIASFVGAAIVYVLYLVISALTNSPLMAASAPGSSVPLRG